MMTMATGANQRPLDGFLALLKGVTINGERSWKALCPIHEDDGMEHTPSLVVSEGQDGKVLVYCHVCKDSGIGPKICTKFGVSIRALFPDYGRSAGGGSGRRKPLRRIQGKKVAEYEYRDADGAVAFKVMRYETDDGKKTFVQARPNGQGGWVLNMRGVRRVPYRLPELIAADKAQPIYIVEGEKKVEALRAWGLPATCNVGGAGKWNRDYSVFFRGRIVVILPDNDPIDPSTGHRPGQEHALKVLESLRGYAKTVRILELPDLPPKGDVVDWQADGHQLPELLELTRKILGEPQAVAGDDGTPRQNAGDAAGDAGSDQDDSTHEDDASLSLLALQGRTDVGNARRLIRDFGEQVRYCQSMDKWFIWTGRRWQVDQKCRIEAFAKDCTRERWRETSAMAQDISPELLGKIQSFLKYSDSWNGIKNCLRVARSEPDGGIQVVPFKLDANPWLLNCRNGTIDLETGELRPHDPADLLTKISPVEFNPEAECPTWQWFIGAVFRGNDDLIAYVQRLVGYWATGHIREQMLPILWGTGANGKTTFLNTVMSVLGHDYCMKATQEFLMAKRGDAHPTEKADLFGKRFVACSETEEGRRLSESLVKEITGGERVRARRMREDHWEFDPTHKVALITNHCPVVSGGDHGIWRRIRLIPFEQQFWDAEAGESGPPELRQDKTLKDRLKGEYSGILTWIVKGCLSWQHDGEGMPDNVRAQTAEYRESQDVIGQWIEECCERMPVKERSSHLYASFREWCIKTGEYAVSNKRFSAALGDRGFKRIRSTGTWFEGLKLMTNHGAF